MIDFFSFLSSNIFSNNPTWSIGIIVVLCGFWLHIYRDRKATFRTAAKEFSAIIHTELKDMYPEWINDSIYTYAYLGSKFHTLDRAVKEFRCYLPWYKRKAFRKAWATYYNEKGEEGEQFYRHYTPAHGSFTFGNKVEKWDYTDTYKTNFKRNVNALLKYAK